ncbi:MAG: formylglycine-generating enzyme family protein [Bacteroidales bacterium]|nr:formylglycine-generating enzyme family protein [Bacteroidales bacterium]
MKKLCYIGMGLALCLLAAVWTGCNKPDDEPEQPKQEQEKPVEPEPVEPVTPGDDDNTPKDYVDTAFGMTLSMVYVEGGTFQMGATEEQGDDALKAERPVHEVTLNDYYIGQFMVTQAQWTAVMGTTISDIINEYAYTPYGVGDDYPMYYVTWTDAYIFCERMTKRTGKTYRLPTEAEWEYAARGGQKADNTKYAGSDDIDEVAWYRANSDTLTHPVGQKKPNGLGLYDMSGNLWEWCGDWYEDYSSEAQVNPRGPVQGKNRVIRGGYWQDGASQARVSNRGQYASGYRAFSRGFRVVCER